MKRREIIAALLRMTGSTIVLAVCLVCHVTSPWWFDPIAILVAYCALGVNYNGYWLAQRLPQLES